MSEVGGEAASRVLLVEDDPDHAELVRRALGTPVRTDVVGDGEAALAFLRRSGNGTEKPHLILLDLRLPRMDGLQLLRELKTDPALRAIPCVVLTTSAAERDMARAYELHANSYLVKPGDHDGFRQLMSDIDRYWLRSNRRPPTASC
jgi:CheY-like chemotaxis protein